MLVYTTGDMMSATIQSLDKKIEDWIMSHGTQPKFLVLGKATYLRLCSELMIASEGADQGYVIKKFRDCRVIVLSQIDILEAVGAEGLEAIV